MTVEHQNAKIWIKQNRPLLRKYRGQWIAYNGLDGLLGHDKNVTELCQIVKGLGKPFILKYVDPTFYSGLRRIVPIRFRPFRQDTWEPTVAVNLFNRAERMTLEMLVDSGADISTISLHLGTSIGFIHYDDEMIETAAGVNGTVDYLIRKVQMEIEGHTFFAPIAWLQDERCEDLLLDREVVFDEFDVEFKQRDELILFKKRLDA